MKTYKLVTGKWTTAQMLLAGLWVANLVTVLVIWLTTVAAMYSGGVYDVLIGLGWLFGLLAAYCALVQFMILGRVPWIERHFGLDRLAHFHRLNGYATILAVVLHPFFIVAAYSVASETNFVAQYLQIITDLPYVWLALLSEVLFLLVAATSVYIVRRKLRFESWYLVHMFVYAAIVFAFFHQFALGSSFNGHPLSQAYWYGLYIFVAANVLFWRFGWPSLKLVRYRYRIGRVVAETATSTSVYIQGRDLQRWHVQAGQYLLVRVLARGYWTQEHPFSVSKLPADNEHGEFRITVRHAGDYSASLAKLPVGAPVLVSGPFGRFTSAVAQTDKRLFVAGGVGITPIRTLAEEALDADQDSVLLYASRTPDDVVLRDEIVQLGNRGLQTTFVYAEGLDALKPSAHAQSRIDGDMIARLVPDYMTRDIYICGPPAMMEGIVSDLQALGVPEPRLHYERFSLHN